MLTVTPEAKQWIDRYLEQKHAADGWSVRLENGKGRVQIQVGRPEPGDVRFEDHGRTYLAVTPSAAALLEDKSLCCRQTGRGHALALRDDTV